MTKSLTLNISLLMISSSSLYKSKQFESVDSFAMSVFACCAFVFDVKIAPNIVTFPPCYISKFLLKTILLIFNRTNFHLQFYHSKNKLSSIFYKIIKNIFIKFRLILSKSVDLTELTEKSE